MKLYKDAPNAGIEMHHDPVLIAALESALKTYEIDVAVETGTFHGKGSTRLVAECLQRVTQPKVFTTVEISFENWVQAKYNLRDCLFVNCLWGSSLNTEAAIAFMQQDDMLINHQNYDDIYIDDIEDPVEAYTAQVRGLARYSDFDTGTLSEVRQSMWSGEDLLRRLLEIYASSRPLILLDSTGGIGYPEFLMTVYKMEGKQFLLLLDDTIHIKHHRSLKHVRESKDFMLLAESEEHSWALAWHAGR